MVGLIKISVLTGREVSSTQNYMKDTLFIPKDPIVIGKMPDGSPIWVNPSDFIPTPDEELERIHNTKISRESTLVEKLAKTVLYNAGLFIEQTFLQTASQAGIDVYSGTSPEESIEWVLKAGYDTLQDGLTTVVKFKGSVVREMTATIDEEYSERVAQRVMSKIKESIPA